VAREHFVGTAGWAIPRQWKHLAPPEGTGLVRYSGSLNAVEINSSFYRPHARKTWERWAAITPADFRFSVKVPKLITHEQKLAGVKDVLDQFLDEAGGLGHKLGVLLLQFPGKFEFDARRVGRFLALLRRRHEGNVVCEPRHASWYTRDADKLLRNYQVARVAADPPKGTNVCEPGAWDGVRYFRLHGSPRCYFSPYDQPFLMAIAQRIRGEKGPVWCIFDNTGSGSAYENALRMRELL
jgi:uncharacterized protein YecE (DUF72 family)